MDMIDRRVIVFDWDGTLADTMGGITSVAREVLLAWGMPEDGLGDLSRLVGPPFPQAYSTVYGLSDEDAAEVTRLYRIRYEQGGVREWPVFPGIPQLLEDLHHAGKLVAVASSKRHKLVVRQAGDNGILDALDAVVGKMDDDAATKEGTIVRVIGLLEAHVEEAVMVGDRNLDVWAAANVGIPCVGVLYGKTAPRKELEEAGAVAIAETLDELRRILIGV